MVVGWGWGTGCKAPNRRVPGVLREEQRRQVSLGGITRTLEWDRSSLVFAHQVEGFACMLKGKGSRGAV